MKTLQMKLEEQLASDVIDTLVQANVDLRTVSLERAKQLIVRARRARQQEADRFDREPGW